MNYEEIEHYTISKDNRVNIDPEDSRAWAEECYRVIEEELRKLHLLSLLEGQLHSDNYHKVKSQFRQMGLHYGFISPYARLHKGSLDLTFTRRYLKDKDRGEGDDHHYYPIHKVRGGFNRPAFKKYASHEDELDLALMTEGHFRRLRKQASEMKSIMRQIKRQETRKLPRSGDKEVNEE